MDLPRLPKVWMKMGSNAPPHSAEATVTFSSGQTSSPPDLRLLHYNDVYHLDPNSAEPVGGVARFVSVCKEYQESERFRGQPKLVTLFSGDVFNPSLESSVTKGLRPSALSLHLWQDDPYVSMRRQSHGAHSQQHRDGLRLRRGKLLCFRYCSTCPLGQKLCI